MAIRAFIQITETLGLSLRNYHILALMCLNGLKTFRFNVMFQYFQQIPSAQDILPKISRQSYYMVTSHSAYAATETELYAAKMDGLLPPNFL